MLQSKFSAWSLVPFLALGSATLSRAQSNTLEVSSPDHQIVLRFSVQPGKDQQPGQDGRLVYNVSFHGKQVFENSGFGLELANQPMLGSAVHIADTTPGSGVDDYTLVAG